MKAPMVVVSHSAASGLDVITRAAAGRLAPRSRPSGGVVCGACVSGRTPIQVIAARRVSLARTRNARPLIQPGTSRFVCATSGHVHVTTACSFGLWHPAEGIDRNDAAQRRHQELRAVLASGLNEPPGGALASRRSGGRRRAERGPHHRPAPGRARCFPAGTRTAPAKPAPRNRPRSGKDL